MGTNGPTIRTVHLRPYRAGAGPTFRLTTWDTGRTDWRGVSRLGYRLTQREHGRTVTLFEGEDFCGSPLHADDSDATVSALLSFLTLRHGDTDLYYFASYTPAQWDYVHQHAEALSCYVSDRFGHQ